MPDGGFSSWTPLAPLPTSRSHHACLVHGGNLYVVGGIQGSTMGSTQDYDDVWRAPILGDGSLGAWSKAGALPNALAVPSAFTHLDRLYVVGGLEYYPGSAYAFIRNVRGAGIPLDGGPLEPFVDAAMLASGRGHSHQAPALGRHVYVLGGFDGTYTLNGVEVGTFE